MRMQRLRGSAAIGVLLFLVVLGGLAELANALELRVPQDYATIGEALAAARPGDVILVAPGMYRENITVGKREVALRGYSAETVIIEARYDDAPVVLLRERDVRLSGLTLRGGARGCRSTRGPTGACLPTWLSPQTEGKGCSWRVSGPASSARAW